MRLIDLFQSAGTINPHIVCPYCNYRNCVRTTRLTQKVGISGGKAAGVLLTGGLSLFLTGLSRKVCVTRATCDVCKSVWSWQ